ncbi:MAG: zinc ribbon domain-containing protein [Firmicutes bacterium]|nr:zinc ribbon domain-containing protein [Bacillota bacterium]
MSKSCRFCGALNEDSRSFCSSCGEPLSKDLKLMMDLDKALKHQDEGGIHADTHHYEHDEDFSRSSVQKKKEEKSLTKIIVPLVIAIIAIIIIFVFVLQASA